jgi:IS1 family transposase
LVIRTEKNGVACQSDEGERWGCLVQDRASRFVVAWATGPLSEALIEQAVTTTVQRTHQRELHWFSDGWHGYRSILERAYRKRVLTGKRGRPRLVVPESVTLMQTVKHRDEHGRLLSVEMRAALGMAMEPAGTIHVERLNGALRDRLNALTRKTHAFAKRDATWDALVGLQLFDHNFHRAHRALRLPVADGVRRYHHRSPAMALGLNDHRWSFLELLTTRIPITP